MPPVHTILSREEQPGGYVIVRGLLHSGRGPGHEYEADWAENLAGDYIGSVETAAYLCDERGIAPECITPGRGKTCSIGFCASEQKWYGWSHRARSSFGIGYVAPEGAACTTSGWLDGRDDDAPVPVGFEVKTLEDARRVAIAFASSVS